MKKEKHEEEVPVPMEAREEELVAPIEGLEEIELPEVVENAGMVQEEQLVKDENDWKPFIGIRTVLAKPMSRGDYNLFRGWTIPEDENPEDEGYITNGQPGHIQWQPKDVFENSFHTIDGMESLPKARVFPSEEVSVHVIPDMEYGGAHRYVFNNCLGYNDGKTEYVDDKQFIQFIQKNDDGSIVPGLQSEQLVLALRDRHVKLNNRFPSVENLQMIEHLDMFLYLCRKRVQSRIDRGVMGELKK